MVASAVCIAITLFWVQNDSRNLIAAKIAQFSNDAIEQRNYSKAIDEIELAIDLIPYAPIFHLAKSNIFEQQNLDLSLQMAQLENEISLAGQGASQEVESTDVIGQARARAEQIHTRQIELLRNAYEEVKLALKWNALDHRAWSRAAEYSRELGASDPSLAPEAIEVNRTLVALLPSYWQTQDALAWAYVRVGQPDLAMAPLERALEITGGSTNDYLAYYIRGFALRDMGRTDEAIEALQKSIDLLPTPGAEMLLSQLHQRE